MEAPNIDQLTFRGELVDFFDNKPNFDTILSVAIFNYLQGTRAELKHVHWPSRAQTIAFTTVVVAMSLATAIILAFFDYLFSQALKLFL